MQSPTPEQKKGTDPLKSRGQSPFSARPRNRRWIWFFVTLSVLTLAAIIIQVWYNLGQQLTLQQLHDAQARWKEKGPRDYDLEYTLKKTDGTDRYAVQVRNGKVLSVLRDASGGIQETNWQPEEERLYRYRDMPALFGFLEDFLQRDTQSGIPRTFATATFDAKDGHLIHYVRSVMSKRERQEITVQFLARNS